MAEIKHFKVVASLPSPLEPDSIYYVRVGQGYDQYVTNGVGVVVAYEANSKIGLESKVDKESGKQLSDENYTLDEKNKLASLENFDDSAIQAELDTKVDKIAGKGLSTEDFTSAEKDKLAELENFDDSAIQAELDTKVDKVVGKQLSTEDYSTEEKNKLSGVEAGAQVNSVTSVAGKTGVVTLNKADVGLSNVDNTSDSNKPVSTAQQAALNLKLDADDNAVSASKLDTPRTISLSGDASGSTIFDGSANATIVVQVADDSHNHVISNVDGLQTALDSKVDKVAGKQLSDENYTLVEKNKLAGVAAGATANATNAQLRDRTTHTGVQPIASVEGLEEALGEKADDTDPRLTNAREWTASVVPQAEAESGTSTTARKWTAQRVRQAILGWWNASTFKTKLDGIEVGATKNATDAQLRSRATHTGVQPISSVTNLQSSLDSKVDKQSGYGLSQENYTPAEKSKLSSLEGSKFKGEYTSLSALQAAQPSPEVGSYAYVDIGVGEVVTKYIWDSSDAEWVKQQGETASVTPAEVKSLYEGNPDTNAFTDSEKSKLSGIQAGATANATNAQLRDRATHTGVQPISSVSGLQAGLDSKADTTYVDTQLDTKVDKTVSVVAGTGLSGGGTLSASRTLNVQYGTAAGTAAQGNDSRLSNSREWTATVVSQTEAEAGTATTARKWTSQRVRQAILGWWNGSSDKTKLDGIESGAQVNSVTSVAGKTGAVTLTHTDVNAAPTSHTHPLSQITDAGNLASLSTNASTSNFLRGDGTWATPPNTNTTYTEITTAEIDAGTASTLRTITGRRMKHALDKKVDTTTQVIAGTGLSGGGTLAANRTLSVNYGTAAGTAAQGNDSRLSDSREWTASAVTQAEAEAGTATTARKWTAQRVRQAILGWWNSSSDKTKLDGIAAGAQVNVATNLGSSGTGATRTITSSTGSNTSITYSAADVGAVPTARTITAGTGLTGGGNLTANRTLSVSYGTTSGTAAQGNDARINNGQTAFGWGDHSTAGYFKYISSLGDENLDSITASGFYRQGTSASASVANNYPNGAVAGMLRHYDHSSYKGQYYSNRAGDRTWYRTHYSDWSDWVEFIHTGNLDSNVSDLGFIKSSGLSGYVPTTRTITAGTGLSGGGTLAANRTLSVTYGTTAGTAAEGNDSRLSNSREWTASVVSQAEAQAGTATTARKWTAQRVSQAISALGLKIGTTSSTAKAGNWMPTWANVTGKPTTFTPASHTHSLSEVTDAGNLAALNTNASTANFLRGDGTWATPPNTNTTYAEITTAEIDAGTASTARAISGRRMKYALDKKSDTGHSHVIGDVTGLQTAIDSKANTSTQVIAGTGLSGGGTLAANRTLSVNYGTAAGTAAQGNDSRLSNSREWTASTVSQTEAQAGTATTRRAWTAQRVRQAILGWWNSSSDKTKLDGIATGATKNATDAQLRARSSHTGTQAISTVAGLQAALDNIDGGTY